MELLLRAVRSRDAQLAALGAVTAAVALALAVSPPATAATSGNELPLAVVSGASGEAARRPAATLGWRRLAVRMGVYDGDSVFVPPGAEATLRFDDGTELSLDERSLIVVERPRAGLRTLRLRQGAVSGRVGAVAVAVETPLGVASLNQSTEARVELGGNRVVVSVKKGKVDLTHGKGGKATMVGGQRGASGGDAVEVLAPWPVTLVAPEANLRRVFRGAPGALEFEWNGALPAGARVQCAHDRLFAFIDREAPVKGLTETLEHPGPGVTWWRLVDERGTPLSEARRFSFVEDVPPAPVQPRAGEVVLSPPGSEVAFQWTALPGVAKYRLEVSATAAFDQVSASFELSSPEVRVRLNLAEGVWYWRARAADGQEPGLPSTPTRFRLIHKGIPDAPELLNPEIEVQP